MRTGSGPRREERAELLRSDAGVALVIVMALSVLLASIGLTILLLANVEIAASGNQRDGVEAFHAADGALDYAIQELAALPDWNGVLAGTTRSRVSGPLRLPAAAGGAVLDAARLTADIQQSAYGGSAWGASTPRWRLFAHGSAVGDVGIGSVPDHVYVLVWVSDDIAEDDSDPWTDSNEHIVVRARAIGLRNSQRDVQAVIARTEMPGVVRKVSWRIVP